MRLPIVNPITRTKKQEGVFGGLDTRSSVQDGYFADMKKYTFPNDKHLEEVVDIVYEKIEDAEIWIPYGEVFKHYKSKRSDINKRIRRSLNEKEETQSVLGLIFRIEVHYQ